MAERLKDNEDKWLESVFSSDVVRDAGFSRQVIARVRRRMWVRRLALPSAFTIGLAVSAKPLFELSGALPKLVGSVPVDRLLPSGFSGELLPQMPTIIMGAGLLIAVMLIGRLLEDA